MTYYRTTEFGSLILAVFLISQIAQGNLCFFSVDWGVELDSIKSNLDDIKDPSADPFCLGVQGGLVAQGTCEAYVVTWSDASEGTDSQKLTSLWPNPTGAPST